MLQRNKTQVYLTKQNNIVDNVQTFATPILMFIPLVSMNDERVVAMSGRVDKHYYSSVVSKGNGSKFSKDDRLYIHSTLPDPYDMYAETADYRVYSISPQHDSTTIVLESLL